VISVKEANWLRAEGKHYVEHSQGMLCLTCATDHPLTGEVIYHESGSCYNCGPDDLESQRPAPRRARSIWRDPLRPCSFGFTPVSDSMVRCDYCDRLVRRVGISGHKQKCGGWKAHT